MVYFAALAVVGLMDKGLPMWAAVIGAFVVMIVVGMSTERLVLRKLVNQPPITLFMATIGLSFFLEGLGPLLFGNEVRPIQLGIVDEPIESILTHFNIVVSKFDLAAALIAAVLVAVLALFFQYTKVGRALRAVADDHQAALSLGIPLQNIWAIVWGVAGFVALVAGMLWGSRNGVQFALTLTALKALPVLILGGFTSVPGAIVGGLIIGASEKLAEIYIPPVFQSMFDRRHSYAAGLVLADQDPKVIGAYHNADIPFFLDYLESFNREIGCACAHDAVKSCCALVRMTAHPTSRSSFPCLPGSCRQFADQCCTGSGRENPGTQVLRSSGRRSTDSLLTRITASEWTPPLASVGAGCPERGALRAVLL